MSLWDHIPPDVLAGRTKNYGLAGGWLTPPGDWSVAVLEEIRALPETNERTETDG